MAACSRTTNDERRTTNDERRTTNDERRTTNDDERSCVGVFRSFCCRGRVRVWCCVEVGGSGDNIESGVIFLVF